METAITDQTIRRPAHAGQRSPHPCRVILVYEDLPSAMRAQDVIFRLTAELKPKFELHNEAWKFELLRFPQLMEEARFDAIEADIIIISARNEFEFPAPVINWIESWLPDQVGRQCSLIALFNREVATAEEVESGTQFASEYLQRIAEIAGMEFFCNAGSHERRFNGFTRAIPALQARRRESSAPGPARFQPEMRAYAVNGSR